MMGVVKEVQIIVYQRPDGMWVAECPNLLWSDDGQGATAQQAIDAIKPTIVAFYDGTLSESGIEAINTHSQLREVVGRQVILTHDLDEGTYNVTVPSVEGVTCGNTVKEALHMAQEVIDLMLESIAEDDGLPIPDDPFSAFITTVGIYERQIS
jgi:predicted RNase H-like HicB family nuclease